MIVNEKKLQPCTHSVLYDCICTECGSFITPDSRYKKADDIYMLTKNIKESAIKLFLLERKKLALIVDLDKTLIDTIRFLNEQEAEKIISLDNDNRSNYLFFKTKEPFLVRLRSYVQGFLESISPYYFMQVYTLSERSYALQIIHKIDPEGKYFKNRILTRENSNHQKKSISDLFITTQNMAVIIDDTRHVWSNSDGKVVKNLVQVKPFDFFPKIKKQNKMKNYFDFVYKNINQKEIKDDYLKRLSDILIEIHSRFYNLKQQNVFDIIKEMKSSVFKGCYIYFCSIWSEGNIQQKNLYVKDAQNNGAYVLKKFVPYVTHIVTTNPINKDVIEAQKYKGIYILNYKWFVNSIFGYQKQPEIDNFYMVTNKSGSAPLVTNGPEEIKQPPNVENNNDLEN